eukprot:scaffold21614_cov24-Phaeocystis_antarctica.AAC.1
MSTDRPSASEEHIAPRALSRQVKSRHNRLGCRVLGRASRTAWLVCVHIALAAGSHALSASVGLRAR